MKKTQADAVVEVMEKNGGYATFGHLYRHVLTVPEVRWGTKTPFASIRRIVQTDKRIYRLEAGLWALESFRNKIDQLHTRQAHQSTKKPSEFSHSYFQGLLLEMGSLNNFDTYLPPQDKNNLFVDKPLGSFATVQTMYSFTYDSLLRSARTVDVIWFNQRKMPKAFFEVEHSTDIYNSLRKFVELQDFHAQFLIVAPEARKREFEDKTKSAAFESIQQRVGFWGYEYVASLHSKLYELNALEKGL